MEHYAGIRQRVATARSSAGQQQGAHAGRLAHAYGMNVRLDVLHGIVHGHPGGNDPAGRIDVAVNGGRGILGLEEQKLGRDQRGHVIVDLTVDANDPLPKETAEYVEGPLSTGTALDDDGDQTGRHWLGCGGYASSTCCGAAVCGVSGAIIAPNKSRRSSPRPQ